MRSSDIILKNYYDIDLKNGKLIFIDSGENEVLDDYITKTVNFVLNESRNCQRYKIRRETNEVFNLICESLRELLEEPNPEVFSINCKAIAEMLLESEIRIAKGAIEPVNGGLVQAVIRKDEGFYYVLIKNEFFSAVNRVTMEMIEAFLHDEKKKAPLKICIFDLFTIQDELSTNFDIKNIFVDDSIQRNHSVYWYDYFLSLDKCNTNEVNTNNALDTIINFWEKNIEEPDVALDLRNDTIMYFRSNRNFDLENYIDNIKEKYEFENEDIFEKLVDISDNRRKGFDRRFEISQEDIKKRIVTKKFYPLTSRTITISIEGQIDYNDIYVTEEHGNHVLKIRTDDENTINALTRRTTATNEN